jgi:hypothetical protein
MTTMNSSHSRARWWSGLLLAGGLALGAMPAIAQMAVGTGAFPKVDGIESQLKRGVSTKKDVQRILGIPNGSGGALLPGWGARSEQVDQYQIWYYEDLEATDITSEENVMKMKMRQQILAVFFKGDLFHGYFWATNAAPLETK